MSNTLDNKDLEKVTGGGYTDYLVRPGDTLSSISEKLGVPMSVLQKLNNITNPDKICAGQKLRYPC